MNLSEARELTDRIFPSRLLPEEPEEGWIVGPYKTNLGDARYHDKPDGAWARDLEEGFRRAAKVSESALKEIERKNPDWDLRAAEKVVTNLFLNANLVTDAARSENEYIYPEEKSE